MFRTVIVPSFAVAISEKQDDKSIESQFIGKSRLNVWKNTSISLLLIIRNWCLFFLQIIFTDQRKRMGHLGSWFSKFWLTLLVRWECVGSRLVSWSIPMSLFWKSSYQKFELGLLKTKYYWDYFSVALYILLVLQGVDADTARSVPHGQ